LIYTDEQQKAIDHRKGNLLIIACAGSGKTEVVSRRIAEIVREGTPKNSIAAFTFTDKAAAELKARIRKHLEEILPEDPALGDMYVGTIHSFCLQILREFKPEFRNFDVIDEEQQVAIICSRFNDLKLDSLMYRHNLKWFETIRLFRKALDVVYLENMRIEGINDKELKESLSKYYSLLQLSEYRFLDFNCVISRLTIEMKSDSSFRDKIRSKFKYLTVDEYQDIDPRQEELIELLKSDECSLCAVGDDDQAIYGWRGADINNIISFETKYHADRITLKENFRSSHGIAEVANASARKISRRIDKSMRSVHWRNEKETILEETMSQKGDIHRLTFESSSAEAEYIANRVEELIGTSVSERSGNRGLSYGDVAVLFRSVRNDAAKLIAEFRRRKIPFVVKGTRGLFEHEEVRLVQAALHLLADKVLKERENSEYVTLNTQELRARIRSIIEESERIPVQDAEVFLEWISAKRKDLEEAGKKREERSSGISRRIFPQDIFHEMLNTLGVGESAWPDEVLFNLGRISNLLTKFESVHQWLEPKNLSALLKFLDGWALDAAEESSSDDLLNLDAVQVSTIHAAKGLEWNCVFVPRVNSRHFPSGRRNSAPDCFPILENEAKRLISGDDGERRLWYVAITRSKKFLEITAVDAFRIKPSGFFKEIRHVYVIDSQDDPSRNERTKLESSPPLNTLLLPTSFSDLNYFWKCPYDYRLRKLMGFGPTIGQEFGYGQQIHNLLTLIHERAKDGMIVDENTVDMLIEEHFSLRYTSGNPLDNLRTAANRSLKNYVKEIGAEMRDLVFYAEKPFEFVLEDGLISGTIDLLERKTDKSLNELHGVVDFKSGIPEENEFPERLEEANRQLRLYAIASGEALRIKADYAVAHFLGPDEQRREKVSVTDEELEKIRGLVKESVQMIKTRQFPKRPRDAQRNCEKCDFKRICPGSEERT